MSETKFRYVIEDEVHQLFENGELVCEGLVGDIKLTEYFEAKGIEFEFEDKDAE